MKDGTYAFYHDYNTRTDAKIKKLLFKHGMVGYGLYWAIVEDLYNNNNSLLFDLKTLAYDLRVDEKTIDSVLKDFNLFQIKKNILSSKAVGERIVERQMKSEKAKTSANKRWSKDANALPSHSERIPNAMQTQSERNAIKEKKEKKRKENTAIADSFSSRTEVEWSILDEQELENWIERNESNFEPRTTRTLPSGRIIANPRLDVPNPFDWGYSPYTGLPTIQILGDEARQRAIEQSKRNGTIL